MTTYLKPSCLSINSKSDLKPKNNSKKEVLSYNVSNAMTNGIKIKSSFNNQFFNSKEECNSKSNISSLNNANSFNFKSNNSGNLFIRGIHNSKKNSIIENKHNYSKSRKDSDLNSSDINIKEDNIIYNPLCYNDYIKDSSNTSNSCSRSPNKSNLINNLKESREKAKHNTKKNLNFNLFENTDIKLNITDFNSKINSVNRKNDNYLSFKSTMNTPKYKGFDEYFNENANNNNNYNEINKDLIEDIKFANNKKHNISTNNIHKLEISPKFNEVEIKSSIFNENKDDNNNINLINSNFISTYNNKFDNISIDSKKLFEKKLLTKNKNSENNYFANSYKNLHYKFEIENNSKDTIINNNNNNNNNNYNYNLKSNFQIYKNKTKYESPLIVNKKDSIFKNYSNVNTSNIKFKSIKSDNNINNVLKNNQNTLNLKFKNNSNNSLQVYGDSFRKNSINSLQFIKKDSNEVYYKKLNNNPVKTIKELDNSNINESLEYKKEGLKTFKKQCRISSSNILNSGRINTSRVPNIRDKFLSLNNKKIDKKSLSKNNISTFKYSKNFVNKINNQINFSDLNDISNRKYSNLSSNKIALTKLNVNIINSPLVDNDNSLLFKYCDNSNACNNASYNNTMLIKDEKSKNLCSNKNISANEIFNIDYLEQNSNMEIKYKDNKSVNTVDKYIKSTSNPNLLNIKKGDKINNNSTNKIVIRGK